ncbi:hypothetical protein [uncultured Thiodictyon sp.]|jgi:hypothetical protein|uniref:hypothetical protein n=1 Tax=uncultured Thiodictyon sp. TaxID=1846217 RepID=UPI0025E46844|nr:hypothetical protein [uncultured Thiodictyon sp.]
MRYVDTSSLVLPDGWEARAKAALAEVAALEPGKRAEAINKRSAIWADLKAGLAALSHGKCWYCESRNERSDNAVDHFRPKNSVKGSARFPAAPGHPGYWWLAFNPHNYRFSCTFCNSIRHSIAATVGGKQDYFPLWDEGHRDRLAEDDRDLELRVRMAEDALDLEMPILLDPTNLADIGALWFEDSGRVVPRPQRAGESDAGYECCKARAEESIVYYHLRHPDITEARQLLAREIRRFAREADKWLDRLEQGLPGARAELNCKMKLLKTKLKPDSEYSAAANCVLRGMRGSSRVAEVLLEQPG